MLVKVRNHFARALILQITLAVALCSVPCLSLLADTFNDKRAYVGLKLFRTLVTADQQLAQKTNNKNELLIYLAFASNDSAALDYQQSLTETMPKVRELNVNIKTISLAQLQSQTAEKPAAIFIAQQFNAAELEQLVSYSIQQKIILFSPFEGDVEKGVLGGLSVEARVQPLINMHTLDKSGVEIKSFYLKVAKQYE
ncbi:YfiR/HmsC family protein [Cellvibrio sp. NN19]|uniref:YfiR/HmsC family protein n=1 Tax=Cellvibrio chitinivorans TaxID=3102792 RepID=UPI002B40D84F|nr:YfiR/HmsC family protein [Cellvibrio sp. NN19]